MKTERNTTSALFSLALVILFLAAPLLILAASPVKDTATIATAGQQIQSQAPVSNSAFIRFIVDGFSGQGFLYKFHFLLYLTMPFLILASSLLLEFRYKWENDRLLFLLGLSEFLFAIGNAGTGPVTFLWFCDYDLVGWIVAILCFLYMLRLVTRQGGLFLGAINIIGGTIWTRILFLLLYIGISVAITFLFSGKGLYWLTPVVIALMWYFMNKYQVHGNANIWFFMGYTGVVFGGFIIFFLQFIGLLMIVALTMFLLRGFFSSGGRRSAPVETTSPSDGVLERAADGTPFVNHSDGTSTQLRDLGDGDFQDGQGNPWHGNGSGMVHK